MELFRVRLNCVDHYQANPTPYDPVLRRDIRPSQRQNEPQVPVVRVFGSTETGQKVCAHVHGAFPYLYIEYTGSLVPDEVGAYIHQLHLSIDHALAVSYRRNAYDGKYKYVARITLVKGVPFYGYHVGYRFFLKIYTLNPLTITRLSDLLQQGAIMKKSFQPFEAHLQFLLQWMTDYNLYGCGYIDCRRVYFRGPVPKYDDMEDDSCHFWHDRSIPAEYILENGVLPRVSHCAIEVDVCVQDILNRGEIKPRQLHHDFIERLKPLPPDEKLVHSMAGLWRDETRRRKSNMVDPDPGSSPFPPEVMMSMSADSRNSQRGGWTHEEEFRESVRELVIQEKSQIDDTDVTFETFVLSMPIENTVKTALESVEDLYPENLGLMLGLNTEKPDPGVDKDTESPTVDVDMGSILNLNKFDDSNDFDYGLEEDITPEAETILEHRENSIEESHTLSSDDIQPLRNAESSRKIFTTSPDLVEMDRRRELWESGVAFDLDVKGNKTQPIREDSLGDQSCSKSVERAVEAEFLRVSSPSTKTPVRPSRLQVGGDSSGVKRRKLEFKKIEMVDTNFEKIDKADLNHPDLYRPYDSSYMNEGRTRNHLERGYSAVIAPLTVNGLSRLSTVNLSRKRPPQEISKSHAREMTTALSFPVVKDPQEPSTVLRLSQGNKYEKSIDSSPKRQASFDFSFRTPQYATKSSVQSSSMESGYPCEDRELPKLLDNLVRGFHHSPGSKIFAFGVRPPDVGDVVSTMEDFNLSPVIYQDAYYSNEIDVPDRAREYAGREFKLQSLTVPFLADFDATGKSGATFGENPRILVDKAKDEAVFRERRRACGLRSWQIGEPPPTSKEVTDWKTHADTAPSVEYGHSSGSMESPSTKTILSQIEGPSPRIKNEMGYTQQQKNTSVQHEVQYMSTMSVEIHVNTRGNFVPNPEEDEVQCIFWCLQSDDNSLDCNTNGPQVGILVLSEDNSMAQKISKEVLVEIHEETSELDLMIRMVEIVRMHDPDILTGYEVHSGSWGYLIERARVKYDYDLCDEFSRVKSQSHGRFGKEKDKWGFNTTSSIRVTGRHVINIWRAMRSELNLLQYTMENVTFHLLQRRIPHYSWRDLTLWYSMGKPRDLTTVIRYYLSRVQLNLQILEKNELIPRTSEQARLLGVDFFSVFSRGSQFKVESLMFRIAKPENFILVSPSRKQVGGQNALECLPLVMEPQSAFYNSPLLVLDFQSLYPSVMIAYNYCYSTFLGRIMNWRGSNKMGFMEYRRQRRLLELLEDYINIAPNGMMYVKPEIRKSLLAKMLGEILETRVMVKSGMKIDKDDKILQRLLNNRQLALKLIANVTYGYTSASFSGRMPCSEIADSIVQTARETLEKAIALICSVERWGAEVVYGDTDSLFIYLKGRTKEQAFDIGKEIADMVTNMNPRPVKLKFEKVYFPCVLLAKKRYVGFKYESKDQKEPEFDAKGIETVRRDGTPAEQKIEERALKILFQTADLSQVKQYFQKQCEKIMKGSVSIQDFCFAREVKLGTYSEKGVPTPGALISTRRMLEDARAEPQYGERVPYVVVTGGPGARLIDRCVSPETLLTSEIMQLDAEYYISKNIIPPLERIFNLVGANVRGWYDEMPKIQRIRRVGDNLPSVKPVQALLAQRTLESFMKPASCLVCKENLELAGPICVTCKTNRPASMLALQTRLNNAEKKTQELERVCQSCSGTAWLDEVKCDSKDCPVFYSRTKQKAALRTEKAVTEPVMRILRAGIFDARELAW